VVVVDLDGVNSQITQDSVESCWKSDVSWDACFANQSGPYYDIWALRHDQWCPNDCWEQYNFLINHGVGQEKALSSSVYAKMISISKDAIPISVRSAFGGLGIYKKRLFESCSYAGINDSDNELCEHVSIHKQMIDNGAKLFIIPSLINGGYNEHSEQTKFQNMIKRQSRLMRKNLLLKLKSKEK
jgi:hypothetical protein